MVNIVETRYFGLNILKLDWDIFRDDIRELKLCVGQASCQRRFREANLRCIADLDKRGRDALFASNVVGGDDDDGLRRRQR